MLGFTSLRSGLKTLQAEDWGGHEVPLSVFSLSLRDDCSSLPNVHMVKPLFSVQLLSRVQLFATA